MAMEEQGVTIQESEGWQLRLDERQALAYVLCTLSGAGDNDLIAAYYREIGLLMDRLVGPGRTFCPVVFDMRDLDPGTITLNAIWGPGSEVGRRVRQLVIVSDSEKDEGSVKRGVIRSLASLMPNIKVTTTVEDAVEVLARWR
jgi:hypothetical protein